jgi:predicted metal-dependent phosphoesterase TrpH
VSPSYDLQSHSVHSDGELSPADTVRAAARAGVELFALTDHDTVAGVDEALEAAAEAGITLVPAIELSIVDEAAADIHVLGYGIDHRDPDLLAELDRFRADRAGRADRMIANLRACGLELDTTAIDARRAEGLPVGRPHLATALLEHPANTERFAAEGVASVSDAIRGYLIEGRPGFAGRTTPTAAEAIAAIHAAGGLAVWAHPFWDVAEPDAVLAALERYAALGLDGVEALYVTHDEPQARLLHEAATARGLLITGSSDFHGPSHPHFSRVLAFETFGLEPRLGAVAA